MMPERLENTEDRVERPRWRRELIGLSLATVICLAPFLDKAYCIDDPLFLWTAAHIQQEPFDFYAFQVNWYGTPQPMHEVTKNPPLACYYLALAAWLVGWSETALHAACLLPAVGTICGTWYLARSLCSQPRAAALVALTTPVFLVSSTNVMCDTWMLCGWIWAIGLWRTGLVERRDRWLILSALLIAAAALTKYFSFSLIPLLAVYTLVRQKGEASRLLYLLMPVTVLALYQWWTGHHYGRGLLLDAAEFASSARREASPSLLGQFVTVVSFAGGCCLPAVFCAPWLVQRRWLAIGLVLAILSGWILGPEDHWQFSLATLVDAGAGFHLAVFALTSLLIGGVLLSDLRSRRDADAVLLALWVGGTVVFAGYFNWVCNGRSLLPLAPALGILLVRRLESVAPSTSAAGRHWQWALLPAGVIALLVTWADYQMAEVGRAAAKQLALSYRPRETRLWFQGHWGFQYYLQQRGGVPLDLRHTTLHPGDRVVIPAKDSNIKVPQHGAAELVQTVAIPGCAWLATWDPRVGAGFYASFYGPLPYVFGPVPPEYFGVWEFRTTTLP